MSKHKKRKREAFKVNREHKDRLFRLIFGTEENKKNLLCLYNALNDSHYEDVEGFEFTTLEDVIYMGMKNDISILIQSKMVLYEHQSTYNPNMPLRGFLYIAKLYEKYIEEHRLNIYSRKLIKLPTPEYIVFYNGMDEQAEEEVLRLSDAFMTEKKIEGYEWSVRILNVNYGKNKDLMEKCKPLQDYAILVDKIRENIAKGCPTQDSIDNAVTECIREDILADFLRKHRAEVLNVCLTEYDEERVLQSIREEEREEGRREERAKTEAERVRADKAEAEKNKAEAENELLKEEIKRLKLLSERMYGEENVNA